MKFTPFGIKSQEFNRVLRGYDKDEVQAFLEQIADEFDRISSENEKYKKEADLLNEQLREFKKIEKSLQSTLLSAQESSTKAIDSVKKQTALMIKEAELKAAQVIEKAKENANAVRDSVLLLREEKNLLIARLTAIVNSQSELLDNSFLERDFEVDFDKVSRKSVQEEKTEINVDEIMEKLL
jgi:cell division initiation protein